MSEIGTETLHTAVEKITTVVEDIRAKAEDGLTKAEIFQLVMGNSDEAIWLATHFNAILEEGGDLDGDLTEGETKELVEKILQEYDAPTPEEEYMVERIIYAAFAIRDAKNAVTDFINAKE